MELQTAKDVLQLVNTQPALIVPATAPRKKTAAFHAIDLTRLRVEARLCGPIAETTLTMTFSNPFDRDLAGDLYFPLPEGAAVSGYALDIGGVMVDGVVVGKARGRQVFEKIVREGVDPGLVEWTRGNNFKTRVFPIPAGGQRTVAVSYLADLLTTADGCAWHLPLNYNDTVADFSLHVEVVKSKATPLVRQSGLSNVRFEKWRDSFVARVKMKDAFLAEDLIVAVPDAERQGVMVERAPDGEYYFCINDLPVLPQPEPAAAPKKITILWDASGSRADADHSREIEILRSYFEQFSGRRIEAGLVSFRHRAEKNRLFWIKDGNCEDLIAAIENLPYDGGTQLACIAPQKDAPQPDFYLLFTDGLSNFGHENPGGFDRPVYIFCSTATANHAFMRHLAMSTAGQYFNLQRVELSRAVAAIGRRTSGYLSAEAGTGKTDGLCPAHPRPVQGRFHLAGRLLEREATVTIHYGTGGHIDHQSQFRVSRAEAVPGSLLQKNWARKKVDDLMVLADRNKEQITAIGKKYGIVTPGTSLIVLDSLEQYIEHGITPPKSLKRIYKDYQRHLKHQRERKEKQQQSKIEHILKLWNERVAWWEGEFQYPLDFVYRPSSDSADEFSAGVLEDMEFDLCDDDFDGESFEPAEPLPAGQPLVRFSRTLRLESSAMLALNVSAHEIPDDRAAGPAIAIEPWNPDTPYLKKLRGAAGTDRRAVYMQQREAYGRSPAFFLDCADFFFSAGEADFGLQVMSNIVELELENPQLLRILAHKLAQLGELDHSIRLLEEVVKLRPEEPQSFRDLGLVLGRRAEGLHRTGRKPEQCRADFSRAIEMLYRVVMNRWDRFDEIELVALMELNRLIPKARAAGLGNIPVDRRLVKLLDVDLRIVLTWDADMTDIDLWVTEPSGEKCDYRHRDTTIGGHLSRDITDGYGPEEYLLKKAMAGVYRVEANYFGSSAAELTGAVTLHLDIFTNYGRPDEKHEALTLRLTDVKEVIKIGAINFKTPAGN